MFEIPQKILSVLKKLSEKGFKAYIVGGCVRDLLMGISPHDYDITTSATPDDIQAIFERSIPTGIKHGTVTVITEGEPVEITTFRADGEYSDCRRPESVKFVKDVKYDLARRDFTVNAICYSPDSGIIDLFGGINDINSKILCCVGNPYERFSEDALRIMRLFRFASVLGFSIEESTFLAAKQKAPLLPNVSVERVNTELTKLLLGKNTKAIDPLIECGGLSYLGIEKVGDSEKLSLLPQDIPIRLFAFLNANNNGRQITERLKYSNKIKADYNTLCVLKGMPFKTKADIKEMLNNADAHLTEMYLKYVGIYGNTDTDNALRLLGEIADNDEPYKIKHLKIDGNDLEKLGIKGEEIGKTLEMLRKEVTLDPLINTREELLKKLNIMRN